MSEKDEGTIISHPHHPQASDSYSQRMRNDEGTSPPRPFVRVAVAQMTSTEDKEANLRQATSLLLQAKTAEAEILFLPEAFDYIGLTKEGTLESAEPLDGPTLSAYRSLAAQHRLWISLGGFHEAQEKRAEDGGRAWITNSHILLDPDGLIVSLYRKIHLFDLDISDQNLSLQESSYVRPGTKVVVSPTTPIGRIGLGICYDLRFPELAQALRAQEATTLTYPSAFTVHTGKAHWETLLRARAIENQSFVIAAAQVGHHNPKRASYGHSMIVDPWGNILACREDDGPGVITANIDLGLLKKVREEMPVMSHKKDFIFRPPTDGGLFYSIPLPPPPLNDDFPFGHVKVKYDYVFLQTPNARAFVNRRCVVPGHVLVSSKRVVERMKDLTSSELSDLFALVQKVQQIMETLHGVSSSTIAIQDGKDAGQTVRHIHVHILPRKSKDFAENDHIYEDLATHDKGSSIQWRPEQDMAEEALTIRNFIRRQFPEILSCPTPITTFEQT